MNRVVLLSLIALVGCQQQPSTKFDLICQTAWSATEPNSRRVGPVSHSSIRYTIDLDNRFWCTAGGCPQGVRNPIPSFTDAELVLEDGPGDYLKINRVTGTLFGYAEMRIGSGDTRDSTTGTCRKAPFTPPAKAKF